MSNPEGQKFNQDWEPRFFVCFVDAFVYGFIVSCILVNVCEQPPTK